MTKTSFMNLLRCLRHLRAQDRELDVTSSGGRGHHGGGQNHNVSAGLARNDEAAGGGQRCHNSGAGGRLVIHRQGGVKPDLWVKTINVRTLQYIILGF